MYSMPRPACARILGVLGLLLATAVACGQARPEASGQDDLDKATEAKLNAKTLKDLDDVIQLCESAQKKGLDKANAKFARQMLTSTLLQRGTAKARAAFENPLARPALRRQALDDLSRAVAIDPDQPEALLNIARLSILEENKKRAVESLDQAIRRSANAPSLCAKALLLRAEVVDDVARRRADLDEAVRLVPHEAAIVLARGLFLADVGEFDKALADIDKAILLAPDRPTAYDLKAQLLARQKKYGPALAVLEKSRALQPDSIAPLVQQARVYSLQSNFRDALRVLDEALKMDPKEPAVLLFRASLYQEKDPPQYDQALADVDQALKLRPGMSMAMRMRAAILAAAGKLAPAVAELEKQCQTHPKDVVALTQLAMLYAAQRAHDKEIATYTAILAENRDDPLVLRSRADAYLGIGKHVEAIADYERLVKVDPSDPGVLNNFAWVLATSPIDKLRNGRRAIPMANDAGRLTEYKQGHILSTMAAAYAETGDFKTAIRWSEKAVQAGAEDEQPALKKELETYKAGKPVRELLTGKEEESKPAKRKAKSAAPIKTEAKK